MLGLFAEEIELNKTVALGHHDFTAETMRAYALRFNPVGFHVDEAAGRASIYGDMTAAGLHVASVWMACFVACNTRARAARLAAGHSLPEIGPSPGFRAMRWLLPVYAGDRIFYSITPLRCRPLISRPGWAVVHSLNAGENQRGQRVLTFESAGLTALGKAVAKA
jgi:acyl dehydratase